MKRSRASTKGRVRATAEGLGERTEKPEKRVYEPHQILSSGSTMLNLACTDTYWGAFLPGHYYFFVGDSDSGKTFCTMTTFAESTLNPTFAKYRLIHDDVEQGCLIDLPRMFGAKTAARIEPPNREKDGTPVTSQSVEEFYDHLNMALDDGRPFIYVLDSQDCLTCEAEEKKQAADLAERQKGKTPAGNMADGKAKVHSQKLRSVVRRLASTQSILIVINQTRDNLGLGAASIYSGGRALKFYAALQLWSKCRASLKKNVLGKEREIGITTEVRVVKNRLVGHKASAQFPIYHSYGIDDIGGCVDYLLDEKHWKSVPKSPCIVAPEFTGPNNAQRDRVIRVIEEQEGGVQKLRELCMKVWNDIREQSKVDRPPRYS